MADGQCPICRGDLERKTIRYTSEYEGKVVVVENVPALVCTQCGEALLEPDVAEKLQEIVWGKSGQAHRLEVDAYDFAQVA
ncbi:MAG: type II toxin-antitoxin system MqsA family antitoxin [Dehalococcoidia bacterium]|nr:type II toxin-antitoxin system MqsA family antitoxin [Dehalococcoidia bacterium]MDZ4277999.1 type II toxin-antitoxin system MqsA family antitoxin [Dehalococcoidia bacterium]